MTATDTAGRSDTMVIGMVGLAHLLSHFYQMALAPLVPLLRDEFDVSYTALGFVISLMYGVSGMCQAFVGILVDRHGADRLMLFGVVTMATAVFLMGLVPAYWMLLPLAVLAAFGNCVFHPADLSILSEKVSPARMGRAFGVHGLGGTVGYFLSPVIILNLAIFASWRVALMTAGVLGLIAAAGIFSNQTVLRMPRGSCDDAAPVMPGFKFYRQLVTNLPLMAAFFYFVVIATAGGGVQQFSVSALMELYHSPVAIAGMALTGYLGASALGIVLGGELADRFPRHAVIATTGLTMGAVFMTLIAVFPLPMPAIIGLMACAGFSIGMTGPSRDILIRGATPKGATGKVFGFVYCGLDVGSSTGPILFGWLMDGGQFRFVFVVFAVMYALGIFSVMQLRRGSRAATAAAE
jgi:FSR family fosmidomycin resistance protein-like MFS transporter